ncbi:hypothetical protein HOE67_05115 [Candidatus Peregrinibacteria bacterium]|jgi:hypothetical protein|nr:hypothetical protein [Candidatus Peregrinibacteria bacterium]MBT4056462.1 hypothetical protein [Candidatus Peregrinibacteria bacterium]
MDLDYEVITQSQEREEEGSLCQQSETNIDKDPFSGDIHVGVEAFENMEAAVAFSRNKFERLKRLASSIRKPEIRQRLEDIINLQTSIFARVLSVLEDGSLSEEERRVKVGLLLNPQLQTETDGIRKNTWLKVGGQRRSIDASPEEFLFSDGELVLKRVSTIDGGWRSPIHHAEELVLDNLAFILRRRVGTTHDTRHEHQFPIGTEVGFSTSRMRDGYPVESINTWAYENGKKVSPETERLRQGDFLTVADRVMIPLINKEIVRMRRKIGVELPSPGQQEGFILSILDNFMRDLSRAVGDENVESNTSRILAAPAMFSPTTTEDISNSPHW